MFCCDQKLVGPREHPPIFQRNITGKGRKLFVDYVIIFELFLQSINIFNVHDYIKSFGSMHSRISLLHPPWAARLTGEECFP